MKMTAKSTAACPFCSGKGYFQLLLGGSETCPSCQGSGKERR
ncbi:YuiA family protein [Bacillus sp. JNUCC-21]